MTALEAILRSDPAKLEEFAADCEACFFDKAGQRLLATLCALAHPLDHSPMPLDCVQTERGRREVVALLWRFGAVTSALPPVHEPNPNTP